jgi:hypothetical protein
MAQYEHLPIFKKAYDLALYLEKIVRDFSRYHKYSVGAELRALSREVMRLWATDRPKGAKYNSEGQRPGNSGGHIFPKPCRGKSYTKPDNLFRPVGA